MTRGLPLPSLPFPRFSVGTTSLPFITHHLSTPPSPLPHCFSFTWTVPQLVAATNAIDEQDRHVLDATCSTASLIHLLCESAGPVTKLSMWGTIHTSTVALQAVDAPEGGVGSGGDMEGMGQGNDGPAVPVAAVTHTTSVTQVGSVVMAMVQNLNALTRAAKHVLETYGSLYGCFGLLRVRVVRVIPTKRVAGLEAGEGRNHSAPMGWRKPPVPRLRLRVSATMMPSISQSYSSKRVARVPTTHTVACPAPRA